MLRSWSNIVALWLIGVLAAAQLPKIAVLVPVLRQDLGLSLAQAGLLVSLLEIGGATLGIAAGLALGRFGGRRFLAMGLVGLLAASLAEAFAPNVAVLFVARALEGVAYLLVVIAAPTMIAAVASDKARGPALALWSTFVAVGVAVGSGVTGLAMGLSGPGGAMLLWAVLCALGLLVALRQPRGEVDRARIALPPPAAWVLTLGFGLYTVFICALTMLLPSFLMEKAGAGVAGASMATGLVSLAALPGSAIAIRILHAGALDRRRMTLVVVPALLATAAVAPFVFLSESALLVAAVAFAVVLLSGIASPLVFARLPAMAGGSDGPRIAAANGLLTQFGAGGALIGPPLGGLVVGRFGWEALGPVVAVLAVGMLAVLLAAERMARKSGR